MTARPLSDAVWHARCSPTEKLVLLCIANHAKPGGGGAYPGIRRMQKLTGFAKSTVEKSIATLVGRGYISIVRHGDQNTANEYQIHIGVLIENELDAPPMRGEMAFNPGWGVSFQPGQGGVPMVGTGVSFQPGRGVPRGVPMDGGGVSRFDGQGVPMVGTEQSTTLEPNNMKALNLWVVTSGELNKALGNQRWRTWIQPLRAVSLVGGVLTLRMPSRDFIPALASPEYGVQAALTKAATSTGTNYERLELECADVSTTADAEASTSTQQQTTWRQRSA